MISKCRFLLVLAIVGGTCRTAANAVVAESLAFPQGGVRPVSAHRAGDPGLVINEILVRNDTRQGPGFLDEDQTKQGWIELYNPGDSLVPLTGYYLSDAQEMLQKWALPEGGIGPKSFLLIWGSGKDRRDPGGALHTSFHIMNAKSIFLTHSDANGTADALETIRVPVDHSFGRSPDGQDEWYFYTEPTPGYANTAANRRPFAILERHISLTVGERYQLTVTPLNEPVVWGSDNPLVSVDPAGGLMALQGVLGEKARATITATSLDGTCVDSCAVTIVDWVANVSTLEVADTPAAERILGAEGEALFYTTRSRLYRSLDGFQTSQLLYAFRESPIVPPLLVTPFGYFLRCDRTIYRSLNLVEWTPTCVTSFWGLLHSFAYYWDDAAQTGYVYAGEYSCDPNSRHSVHRGTFRPGGEADWKTILTFASPAEWQKDPARLDAARHVHAVAVDPYTGHVWVTTGDADAHCRILYSDDRGDSFRLVGMGRPMWRTLSLWFTERYVYWSMDTGSRQSLWRISRSRFEEGQFWPSNTPELASGMTKAGVYYYVTASEAAGYFPKAVGGFYVETQARLLSDRNRIRALDDPQYDYTEEIAQLFNGTLWYHLWVNNDAGDSIVIIGGAAEGAQRDYRGRVFGMKELSDGSVDVQELLSVSSIRDGSYDETTRFVQLEPMAQDGNGYIYFTGRATNHKAYKTRLIWTDHLPPQ